MYCLHALMLDLLRPFGLTLWRTLDIETTPDGASKVRRGWKVERRR